MKAGHLEIKLLVLNGKKNALSIHTMLCIASASTQVSVVNKIYKETDTLM